MCAICFVRADHASFGDAVSSAYSQYRVSNAVEHRTASFVLLSGNDECPFNPLRLQAGRRVVALFALPTCLRRGCLAPDVVIYKSDCGNGFVAHDVARAAPGVRTQKQDERQQGKETSRMVESWKARRRAEMGGNKKFKGPRRAQGDRKEVGEGKKEEKKQGPEGSCNNQGFASRRSKKEDGKES